MTCGSAIRRRRAARSFYALSANRRLDLQFPRASGLAQARLQVAVLSGNRRRALEQIDRLVAIDKQLERLADGPPKATTSKATSPTSASPWPARSWR